MKKYVIQPLHILALLALFSVTPMWAQDDLPPDTEDPDDELPLFIDGLIGAGIVAGAAYAYRKIK